MAYLRIEFVKAHSTDAPQHVLPYRSKFALHGVWQSTRKKLYNYPYRTGAIMDTITYSAARANLASTMDRVCDDHEPLIITRNKEQSVVMISLEDFQSLEETAYLLRSPENARRLLAATAQLTVGQGKGHELISCD
jgi:antitoxin YefM